MKNLNLYVEYVNNMLFAIKPIYDRVWTKYLVYVYNNELYCEDENRTQSKNLYYSFYSQSVGTTIQIQISYTFGATKVDFFNSRSTIEIFKIPYITLYILY